MTPLHFAGSPGYLHEAGGDCLVLMAGAVGYEQLCVQRMWRDFAERIAAAGYPVLRFDWAGCGDALGSDADPQRCDAWEQSFTDALTYARSTLGMKRIAVVGMRLGALIAARVLATTGDVEAMAILAPPANGRMHARELAALAKMIGTREPPPGVPGIAEGDFEVAGFLVTAQTRVDMEVYDLRKLSARPAAKVQLLTQPGLASAQALAEHLVSLGADVESGSFEGYQELMAQPTFSTTNEAPLLAVIDWLKANAPLNTGTMPLPALPPARLATGHYVEESVILGGEGPIAAVWCRPVRDAHPAAVLFVNAGGNPRAGWARMNVDFARTLASDGITSLRIDVAGLGDSPPVTGRKEQVMYEADPRRDVAVAVDALRAAGFAQVMIFGLCSGAHLAFHTAVEHEGVTGFVLVNLQKFIWRATDRFDIALRNASFRSNEHYKAALRRKDTWLRLMRGDINVTGITRAVSRRLLRTLGTRAASAGRGLGLVDDDTAKVRRWFRDLSKRGARGLVIFSAEDGGLDEVFLHMGAHGRDLTRLPGMDLQIIEGADHNVTPGWARRQLISIVRRFLLDQAKPEATRSAAQ